MQMCLVFFSLYPLARPSFPVGFFTDYDKNKHHSGSVAITVHVVFLGGWAIVQVGHISPLLLEPGAEVFFLLHFGVIGGEYVLTFGGHHWVTYNNTAPHMP